MKPLLVFALCMETADAFFKRVLPRLLDFSTWREYHHPEDKLFTWRYYHREEFLGDDAVFVQLEEIARRCNVRVSRKAGRPNIVVFGVSSSGQLNGGIIGSAILVGYCGEDVYAQRQYAHAAGLCPAPRRDCAHCRRAVANQDEMTVHHNDWWCDTCVLRNLDHGW